jgi:hypothetical protein
VTPEKAEGDLRLAAPIIARPASVTKPLASQAGAACDAVAHRITANIASAIRAA